MTKPKSIPSKDVEKLLHQIQRALDFKEPDNIPAMYQGQQKLGYCLGDVGAA